MLAGHVKGCKTSLSSMFEAVGAYAAGKMTEEDVKEYEKAFAAITEFVVSGRHIPSKEEVE